MWDGVELAQSTAIARFDLRFDSGRIYCGVLHFLIAVDCISEFKIAELFQVCCSEGRPSQVPTTHSQEMGRGTNVPKRWE